MIRIAKPRNARSKRALEKRESKEYENAKTAVFVRGPHSSDKVSLALRELSALKKPHSIPFNKQNDVVPFEDSGSIEFWGKKNDAALFLLANHQKKRPHNLTFARLFDGQILDMYEMGIVNAKGHESFKAKHSPIIGARPLFHFSGPHFDSEGVTSLSMCTSGVHQSMQHIKSLFLDLYRGEEMAPGTGPGSNPGQAGAQVALKGGLQHLIAVYEGPLASDDDATLTNALNGNADLAALYKAGAVNMDSSSGSSMVDTSAHGRIIHFRVYAIVAGSSSGAASTLEEIGPSFDFVLRRRQMPSADRLNASLRRPKTHDDKNRQGKAGAKKNISTDDMGDTMGRVHVGQQDLSKLQTRKMKGLKRRRGDAEEDEDELVQATASDQEELEMEEAGYGADDAGQE